MADFEKPKRNESKIDVDTFVENFPKKIPGAKDVDVVDVKGAKHCLIHIRQLHLHPTPGLTQKRIEEFLAMDPKEAKEKGVEPETGLSLELLTEVTRSQRDVFSIASFLVSKVGVRELYTEGEDAAMMNAIRISLLPKKEYEKERVKLQTRQQALLQQYTREKDPEKKKAILNEERQVAQTLANLFFRGTADTALQGPRDIILAKRVNMNMAEDGDMNASYWRKLRDSSIESPTGERDPKIFAEFMKAREDFLLRQPVKNGHPLALTVFGANHDFRENVQRWNREHPDRKYSLIVITPKSYGRGEPMW